MTDRRSYSRLSSLPAWGLYDVEGGLVASVRAETAEMARILFRTGCEPEDVRRGVRVGRIRAKESKR